MYPKVLLLVVFSSLFWFETSFTPGPNFFYIGLNFIFFGTDIFAVNDYQIGGNEGEKEGC